MYVLTFLSQTIWLDFASAILFDSIEPVPTSHRLSSTFPPLTPLLITSILTARDCSLDLERLWAAKAFAHADAYERLLNTFSNKQKIRLTKYVCSFFAFVLPICSVAFPLLAPFCSLSSNSRISLCRIPINTDLPRFQSQITPLLHFPPNSPIPPFPTSHPPTPTTPRATTRLFRIDDDIYTHFRTDFPDLNITNFDYEDSKSDANKEKWRLFANKYNDETVKDFNMATLMRLNALTEFSPENSCIVLRIQFHAIEIARNREGINEKRVVQKDDETKETKAE